MSKRRSIPAVLTALVAALLCLPSCGNGDEADHLTVSASRMDFGRVLRGTKVVRSVVLRNGGSIPVAVQATHFNCACFKMHPFQRMLQPGDERELKVTFDSWSLSPGLIRGKKLTIVSTDAQEPRIEVAMDGEIVASCLISPEAVNLDRLEAGKKEVIKVRPGPGMDIELVDWRVTRQEALEGKLEELPGGEGYDVTVRVRDGARGPTPFAAALELQIKVESRGWPTLNLIRVVPIRGEWPN